MARSVFRFGSLAVSWVAIVWLCVVFQQHLVATRASEAVRNDATSPVDPQRTVDDDHELAENVLSAAKNIVNPDPMPSPDNDADWLQQRMIEQAAAGTTHEAELLEAEKAREEAKRVLEKKKKNKKQMTIAGVVGGLGLAASVLAIALAMRRRHRRIVDSEFM